MHKERQRQRSQAYHVHPSPHPPPHTHTHTACCVCVSLCVSFLHTLRFMEEDDSCDFATRLAATMGWVEPQHLLVADYLHQHWQPDRVREGGSVWCVVCVFWGERGAHAYMCVCALGLV